MIIQDNNFLVDILKALYKLLIRRLNHFNTFHFPVSLLDALAVCGISISKETAATLLSDMTSISVDDSNAVKEKAKKDKVSVVRLLLVGPSGAASGLSRRAEVSVRCVESCPNKLNSHDDCHIQPKAHGRSKRS